MKPPVCRLCGAPHWLNQPHVFGAMDTSAGERILGINLSGWKEKPVHEPVHKATNVDKPAVHVVDTCPNCRQKDVDNLALLAKIEALEVALKASAGRVDPPEPKPPASDRKAYKREWMAKRRAAAKETKP